MNITPNLEIEQKDLDPVEAAIDELINTNGSLTKPREKLLNKVKELAEKAFQFGIENGSEY